jgi:ATP-dependent DNA helicase Rep
LESWHAVDFDDLILKPLELLEKDKNIQSQWQDRVRYLLVDEYQDTNVMQYRLLKALVGPRAAFTAVGDDDQSIYAWRGASLENIRDLQNDFPTLEVIKLEQNYRSTNRILQAANRLIANNPKLFDKTLWSAWGLGDPIRLIPMENEEQEAARVCTAIAQHRFQNGGRFGDYAVLYRSNHQARLFEEALRKENIPYTVSGGQSFFERSEIKDISAYLRLLINEDDYEALIRAINIPRRGLGTTTLKGLGFWAQFRGISLFEAMFEEGVKQHIPDRSLEDLLGFGELINQLATRAKTDPAHEVLQHLLEHIGYKAWLFDQYEEKDAEQRWEHVQHFVAWVTKKATEDGKTLLDIAQTIQLISLLTEEEDNPDVVKLSTLHAAKGLEFKHVYLVGVEEGILPHIPNEEDLTEDKLFEERRLMYVGVTRARESLTITWCKKRKRAKEAKICQPSRFIQELGLEAEKKQEQEAFLKLDTKSRFAQLKAILNATEQAES